MLYRFFADVVLVIHLFFVLFVIGGALLVVKWPRIAWLHMPAAVWGALIEFMGWICPLTPLENRFLMQSGKAAYEGDFIGRYVLPILYPTALSRETQIALGLLVVFINAGAYGWLLIRTRRMQSRGISVCTGSIRLVAERKQRNKS
jgi:hypothetical protein